jgi:hypothetical protein
MVTYIPKERLTYWQLTPEEKLKLEFSDIYAMAELERTKACQKAHTNRRHAVQWFVLIYSKYF